MRLGKKKGEIFFYMFFLMFQTLIVTYISFYVEDRCNKCIIQNLVLSI